MLCEPPEQAFELFEDSEVEYLRSNITMLIVYG
jgi:hypothetical protein